MLSNWRSLSVATPVVAESDALSRPADDAHRVAGLHLGAVYRGTPAGGDATADQGNDVEGEVLVYTERECRQDRAGLEDRGATVVVDRRITPAVLVDDVVLRREDIARDTVDATVRVSILMKEAS